MDIVYFDNHIVVVHKTAGIPTQSEEETSVEKEARIWAKDHFGKKGDVFLHALHRIDKPVSGLVLLAKTSKALERLHASFRAKQMRKTYFALVEGSLREDFGVMEDFLVQEEYKARVATSSSSKAKACRLSYKVIRKTPYSSLVEIDLETGRYHQIRCQFANKGHPIVGDSKYGAKCILRREARIALHHQKMEFPHPVTKELLRFEVLPSRSWDEWEKDLDLFF